MVVRLGAAICVAAMTCGYSSSAFADSVAHSRDELLPRSQKVTGQQRNKPDPVGGGAPISGVASTYNPYRPGWREGGRSTASGERYDPAAWTAAIKTSLRTKFGGVHYGTHYRPAYALVESADKQVVVRINDVGPLTPGRVIDLNEKTMYYFDPTLDRGLIRRVKVTPLPGAYWTPGPVDDDG
jgi:rare lipoprotein A